MRVDLRRIKVLMAQNLLHGLDVHAALQHQRRRCVAQLVRGILRRVEPGLAQVLFHQRVDRRAADALVAGGEEEGVLIAPDDGAAHGEIAVERFLARVVEVDDAHLVSFTEHAQRVVLNVRGVERAKLGNTQAAVQKERQDAVIPLAVLSVHRGQQLHAFFQGEVFRQRFLELRRIEVLDRIFLDQVDFVGQILVKRADRCNFTRSGGSIETIAGGVAVLVQYALAAQIGHIAVDVCERDGGHEIEVDVQNGYFIQLQTAQRWVARLLEITEKVPQIEKVFVHGFSGVRLDRFMVGKKVAQDRRRFGTVIVHELSQKQLSFKAGDPDRPKDIIEQNKNFVQKRVAIKRFFGCFCVPPFRKDNYFTEVFYAIEI